MLPRTSQARPEQRGTPRHSGRDRVAGFRRQLSRATRAHFRDLGDDGQPLPDVKVLVLGNGQIGKTQICRRLRGEPFDTSVPSTHGIMVTSAPLAMTAIAGRPGQEARLHLWDFGGQDLYHGTHGLFLRTRSIFVIVWTDTVRERGHPRARGHDLPQPSPALLGRDRALRVRHRCAADRRAEPVREGGGREAPATCRRRHPRRLSRLQARALQRDARPGPRRP